MIIRLLGPSAVLPCAGVIAVCQHSSRSDQRRSVTSLASAGNSHRDNVDNIFGVFYLFTKHGFFSLSCVWYLLELESNILKSSQSQRKAHTSALRLIIYANQTIYGYDLCVSI